jgi:hypothetical protein
MKTGSLTPFTGVDPGTRGADEAAMMRTSGGSILFRTKTSLDRFESNGKGRKFLSVGERGRN